LKIVPLIQTNLSELVRAWSSDDPLEPLSSDTSYDALADAAANALRVAEMSLYVIDPRESNYRRRGTSGAPGTPTAVPALPRAAPPGTSEDVIQGLIHEVITMKQLSASDSDAAVFYASDHSAHIVGICFVMTVYSFFLVMQDTEPSGDDIRQLAAFIELTFLTTQNSAARLALKANQTPIDITADTDQFYDSLARYIVDSTGMELMALRRRGASGTTDENNLWCTALSGWDRPKEDFDMPNYSRFAPFDYAITNGQPLFSPDRSADELQEFWGKYPFLQRVESFAIFPIKDDERVVAVLSVATSCRMDFTPTFRSILAGIARFVGFTLKNRELHYERAELQSGAIETANALNTVEIYSDLTHQMGNALSAIPEVIETISTAVGKGKDLPSADLLGDVYLGAIETSHDRLSELVQQAGAITTPPRGEIVTASIANIWRDAKSLVQFRARKFGVLINTPLDYRLDVYDLQIRQVFFHLMLNSIAAFASRTARRQANRIDLITHVPRGRSEPLKLRYVDNAGGINPATLRQRTGLVSTKRLPPLEQAIFLRGVTSRPKGTGNGLWIVRQILRRHYGGIELIEHRDGIIFDITLPTDFRERVSQGRVM
jgi:nitrogen-specific signal transduction histidine kinase